MLKYILLLFRLAPYVNISCIVDDYGMNEYYVESFLQVIWVTIIVTSVMVFFYIIFGLVRTRGMDEPMKRDPYSGGKSVESQATFFKATFFQYAIYFLIFDVVAFITALAAFTGSAERLVYPSIYLGLVLLLFLILPKHEGEII